jgi:hypothetical protein
LTCILLYANMSFHYIRGFCVMEPLTAFVQIICLLFGYQDKHDKFMDECLKTKTKVECQQLWRDKK